MGEIGQPLNVINNLNDHSCIYSKYIWSSAAKSLFISQLNMTYKIGVNLPEGPRAAGPLHALVSPLPPQSSSAYSVLVCIDPLLHLPPPLTGHPNIKS